MLLRRALELHAARFVLFVGLLDVVAGKRKAREGADAIFLSIGGEEDEARLGIGNTQLDPALFTVEWFVRDNGEAQLLGVEVERAVLVLYRDAGKFEFRNHGPGNLGRRAAVVEEGGKWQGKKACPFIGIGYPGTMPRFRQAIPVDDYVFDVLMRDLVGHDQQPAAFLVYLWLYGLAARKKWRPVVASLRLIADHTGLSKSAVQSAFASLQQNELIVTQRLHATAVAEHRVLRHWRT